MAYDSNKSTGRSTREPKSVGNAPSQSNQERATSDGERKVVPQAGKNRSFGNQVRVTVNGTLKNPLNYYSSVTLPAVSNPSKKK